MMSDLELLVASLENRRAFLEREHRETVAAYVARHEELVNRTYDLQKLLDKEKAAAKKQATP